jgi:hypothetical protein
MTYTFGPLERRGLLGPLHVGQAATVGVGVLMAIVVIDESPSAGGALLALVLCALALVASFAPVGGRTAQQWAPVTAAFAVRGLTRHSRFASEAPLVGTVTRGFGHRSGLKLPDPEPQAPPELRGVRIVATEYRDRTIGALSERSGRRLTAVLACRVVAFALLDAEAQERRLARWGLVLSGAGGTAIRRLQWIERTAPAQGDELARWVHAERDPAVPLRGTPMIESYLELIGDTTRVTQEHEILVAVQVDGRRVRDRGRGAITAALVRETERIAQRLEAAEVTVLGALGPAQVGRALRTAFDPYARGELTALEAADREREGVSEAGAWPLGAREGWDHYRSDGAVHAT